MPLARLVDEGAAAAGSLIALDDLLPDLPGVVVNERGARRAAHGNSLGPSDIEPARDGTLPAPAERIRVLDAGGRLLAIAEPLAGGALHPKIVLV